MTPRQKELVQQSWAKVVPIADTAAALFYARLFELDPSLRPLFSTDIKEQGKKLMQMISVAVRGLEDLDALVPAVQALGRRHGGYGVKDEHYATVAAALLWTLEKGLGESWNAELQDAWIAVYTVLAGTMKQAAVAA
jgi:hemoglobin-like flavoprotein